MALELGDQMVREDEELLDPEVDQALVVRAWLDERKRGIERLLMTEEIVQDALVELGRGTEVRLHARREALHGVASSRKREVASSWIIPRVDKQHKKERSGKLTTPRGFVSIRHGK
jgi:ParB-like chromosome segregation protein Spo0J